MSDILPSVRHSNKVRRYNFWLLIFLEQSREWCRTIAFTRDVLPSLVQPYSNMTAAKIFPNSFFWKPLSLLAWLTICFHRWLCHGEIFKTRSNLFENCIPLSCYKIYLVIDLYTNVELCFMVLIWVYATFYSLSSYA